jgi:hypothetical protein
MIEKLNYVIVNYLKHVKNRAVLDNMQYQCHMLDDMKAIGVAIVMKS